MIYGKALKLDGQEFSGVGSLIQPASITCLTHEAISLANGKRLAVILAVRSTGLLNYLLPRIRGATGPDKQRAATRKGFASAKARGNKAIEQARNNALLIRPG